MMRLLRSLFGFAVTLGIRRASRDAALLLSVAAVLAVAVLLTIALPRLVLSAIDSGAQEAVADAGREADIVIETDVGEPRPFQSLVSPQTVLELSDDVLSRLPTATAQVYRNQYLTVLSQEVTADVPADKSTPRLNLRLGMLTPASMDAVTVTSGNLPSQPRVGDRTEIDIVVSTQAAEAAGLSVGDVLKIRGANVDKVVAVVSGIIAPVEQGSQYWEDMPLLLAPIPHDSGSSLSLTALTDVAGIAAAEPLFSDPLDATIRITADPSAFSNDAISHVLEEIGKLRIDAVSLAADSGADLTVRSAFTAALDEYPGRARAAVAQMLVLVAGVLGVASAVVMLLSRLVVLRRSAEVALERARGASLGSIVVRSLFESMVITALGAVVGFAAALLLWGAAPANPAAIIFVLAVGVLATPVQAAIRIFSADRVGRRTSANRADRRDVERRARARRFVLEASVLTLAAAALYAVRSRGLLQTRTEGVDPLLAAAPLLLAIAVTTVVLRVYPLVVRLVMSIGRRSRGALGVLGAMQAKRSLAILPLATLTLAISLVVSGGLLVETVRSGQIDASWQRTGAEARVEGTLTDTDVATVAAADGVTAASGILIVDKTPVTYGGKSDVATVVAVDAAYDDLLELLPPAAGVVGAQNLAALFAPVAETDPLPVLVDSRLSRTLGTDDIILALGGDSRRRVEAHIVGTLDSGIGAYHGGPFIYIDRAAVASRVELSVDVNTMLVMGAGAASEAEEISSLDGTVFSREGWFVDRQQQALVGGVNTVMLASTGIVGLLALIGLVASVLVSSRSRRRSLSLLRTLGMSSRLGWWLALSELAPMVLAALIGGVTAGVGIVVILGPSFGLETLAGGVEPPALTIAPWLIGAVAAGAVVLALLAMLVEVVAHRRDRLSDVLRVGESL